MPFIYNDTHDEKNIHVINYAGWFRTIGQKCKGGYSRPKEADLIQECESGNAALRQ